MFSPHNRDLKAGLTKITDVARRPAEGVSLPLSKGVLEFGEVKQVHVGVGIKIREAAPRSGIVARPAEDSRPVFGQAVVEKVQVKERHRPVAVEIPAGIIGYPSESDK